MASQETENECAYCERRVVNSVSCVECGAQFHPSCSTKARVVGSDGVISCCKSGLSSRDNDQLFNRISLFLQKQFEGFKKEMESKYLSQIVELKRDMTSMSTKLVSQEAELSSLKTELSALKSGKQSEPNNFSSEEFVSELEDRRLRSRNLMFYNVTDMFCKTIDLRN